MTDIIWGFFLGLVIGSFGVCLTLALAYFSAPADADELADWRELDTKDDWEWIG